MRNYDESKIPQHIESYAKACGEAAEQFLTGNSAPGIAYGVVHGGRVVVSGGAGVSRLAGPAPDARSIFRIASMTKSFTAAAILQLRDAGKLRLDDPVSAHVPELSDIELPTSDSRMPTLRDLLTMQPGWATDDPWADRQESISADDYTSMLREGFTFNERPGTDFEYSNLGYTILGRVITNASGIQYQDYVTSRILRPLGMMNTGFTLADVDATLLADGHYRRDEEWHVEPTAPTGEFSPLGGLFSNVEDLAVWVTFMCYAFKVQAGEDSSQWEQVLSRDSRREMQQGHRFVFASAQVDLANGPLMVSAPMYAFGLMSSPSPRFGITVGHSGGYPGYGTHMVWHPVTGVGVIALTNGRYGGGFRVATQIFRGLLAQMDAPSRVISPTSATKSAFIHVNRLLVDWDDTVADVLFSPNVDEDEPRAHRLQAIAEQIAKVGGITGPAEEISSTAASHLAWWLPCASGRLRVEIRLAPQRQQKLQTLTVRAVPAPTAETVAAAKAIATALFSAGQWPQDVEPASAADVASLVMMAGVMRAFESSMELVEEPVSAVSPQSATFRIKGSAMNYDLTVVIDDDGKVSQASLGMVALTSDDNALVRL